MQRRIILSGLIAGMILTACGKAEQRVNEAPSYIYRRPDAAFAETRKGPDAATLAQADAVDHMEALFADGRDGECREQLTAFFAAGGNHPRAYDLQGRLLMLDGKYEAAADSFSHAVAASPRWLQPRLSLAECYQALKRPAAAGSVYAEVDRLIPKAPWGPWGQGVVAAQAGEREKAVAFLDEALRRDPVHAPSLRVRAMLAGQMGNKAEEEALWLRFVTQVGDEPSAWTRLSELAEADQRLIDAERYLAEAYAQTGDPRLARRLQQLCERSGDTAGAARWKQLAAP